ncbi:MAG TPA: DUF4349 domain-containing protein [Gaiellaceae bacterium]|nr:DUF4349 domain-containing protein [Gaiellaceae bacterium]
MSPELVAVLRSETPAAPDALRERVAAVTTATPPAPRRFTARRVLAFAAPVVAALSLAAAVAVGLNTAVSPGPGGESAAKVAPPAAQDVGAREAPGLTFGPIDEAAPESSRRSAAPAPGAGRAQDYRATLTLLVDGTGELSTTTQKALRTARRLGGYVVAVSYSSPEPGEGTAAVRLRIPVSRVQAAIVEFSGLGRILAQDTRISDLQQGLDELTREIRRLERRAATLKGEERARLLAQIARLRSQRAQVNRQAAFATVNLDLTTHEPKEPAAAPGRLERALDDAVGILLAELAIAAYALIVASPLLILLAAGLLGNRAYRRHADQRLLERA